MPVRRASREFLPGYVWQPTYRQCIEEALTRGTAVPDDRWSEAIAVGSLAFVEKVRSELGIKPIRRKVTEVGGTYTLREDCEPYAGNFGSESALLMPDNTISWKEDAGLTER
jgi:hypothetical protein